MSLVNAATHIARNCSSNCFYYSALWCVRMPLLLLCCIRKASLAAARPRMEWVHYIHASWTIDTLYYSSTTLLFWWNQKGAVFYVINWITVNERVTGSKLWGLLLDRYCIFATSKLTMVGNYMVQRTMSFEFFGFFFQSTHKKVSLLICFPSCFRVSWTWEFMFVVIVLYTFKPLKCIGEVVNDWSRV